MSKHFLKKMRAMELLKERIEIVKAAGVDGKGEPTPAIVAYKDPAQSDQTIAIETDLTIEVVRALRRDSFGIIVRSATTPEAKIAELERLTEEQSKAINGLADRIDNLEKLALHHHSAGGQAIPITGPRDLLALGGSDGRR